MNVQEIKKMLDLLGIAPSKAELEEFVDMFDSTGDKRLDFPEFLSMILRQYERTDEEQDDDMADAYEMFKDDAEDFITAQALYEKLNKLGAKLTMGEIEDAFDDLAPGANGRLGQEQFRVIVEEYIKPALD